MAFEQRGRRTLQADAARTCGLTPERTRDIAQSLWATRKLITCHCSDCEFVGEELHDEAPGVLAAIAKTSPVLARMLLGSDPLTKSRAFNSTKVATQYGIVPTETVVDLAGLSDGEQIVYLLIARSYIAQFWPKYQYHQTDVLIEAAGHRFGAQANVTTQLGWVAPYHHCVSNDSLAESDEYTLATDLRRLRNDQTGGCTGAAGLRKETKPEPLYTMATLLDDLPRIANYVRIAAIKAAVPFTNDGAVIAAYQLLTLAVVDQLRAVLLAIDGCDEQIAAIAPTLPNYALFSALPGAGSLLAPRLLVAFGEQRERFHSASEFQQYCGVAPIFDGSGNKLWVHGRWQCSKFLRQTMVEWSAQTITTSFWAGAYYCQQRDKGSSHQVAVGALAYKWVLYRCWQTRTPYDESVYLNALRMHGSPVVGAAAGNN